MSEHDPIQMTGDPNWCAERYENPTKCKANNCPCSKDIVSVVYECNFPGCDKGIHYKWLCGFCVEHQAEVLFS